MKPRISVFIFIIAVSSACSKNRIEQQTDRAFLKEQDTVIADSKIIELARTVLNLPVVVKGSKAEFIQRKYGKVFVFFDQNELNSSDSIIYQNSFPLEVIRAQKSLDNPCYVFKKIDIRENAAYVLLHFDITGFFCDGNLNYINGKWVPDKDFKVGYR